MNLWRTIKQVKLSGDYISLHADGLLTGLAEDSAHPSDRLLIADEAESLYADDWANLYGDDEDVLRVMGSASKLYSKKVDSQNADLVTYEESAAVLNPDLFPLDFLVCDFHHNIGLFRSHYRPEPLLSHVKLLHKRGLFAEKFTIAIDSTIDFIASPEINAFLSDDYISGLINQGKMNFAFFRSGQKFEQLGMDNYYGGYSITVNKESAWSDFNNRMNLPEDELGGMNRQAHTHLSKHAAQYQGLYHKLIMENTHKLYSALVPGMGSAVPTDNLRIMRSDDPYKAFLDLKVDDNSTPGKKRLSSATALMDMFRESNRLEFSKRPSFGFATTNFVTIGNAGKRLTPGLDSDESINKWADFFNSIYNWYLDGDVNKSLPLPACPSDAKYAKSIKQLLVELPDEIQDDSTFPIKLKISEDERAFEISFPPHADTANALPANYAPIAKKIRLAFKSAFYAFNQDVMISCSIGGIDSQHPNHSKLLFSPGFEFLAVIKADGYAEMTKLEMKNKMTEKALKMWPLFFAQLAEAVKPLATHAYLVDQSGDVNIYSDALADAMSALKVDT